MDKVVGKHSFTFNSTDNGGEQLILHTTLIDNEDYPYICNVIINQTLTLHSYCNSVSLNLHSAILTPEILRKLADELEEKIRISRELTLKRDNL